MNKPEPTELVTEARREAILALLETIRAEGRAMAARLEEAERDAGEMRAQLRHLIDDITHCLNPSHPNKRYIKPRCELIFSNMVNASIDLVERADAAITKEQP